jgi:hypothetical protein
MSRPNPRKPDRPQRRKSSAAEILDLLLDSEQLQKLEKLDTLEAGQKQIIQLLKSRHTNGEVLESIFRTLYDIEETLNHGVHMAIPAEVQALIDQAKAGQDVEASALLVIKGISARIAAAVKAVVDAGGLSPEDAKTITDATAASKAEQEALAEGIAQDAAGNPTPNPV